MKWLLCLLLVSTGFAWGQHNNRSARDLQFRFGNPGARSMGFGGAFIALADDATAPLANPAGMIRTAQRSASFEFNFNRIDNDIPYQSGTILQTNVFEFDFDLEQSSAPENIFQVPYLAVVFPKNRWRLGVFAHQQLNLKRSYTTDAILICHLGSNFHPNCDQNPNPDLVSPSTDVLDLQMINLGFSAAYDFGGGFSLGTSLFYSDLDYQADSTIVVPQVLDVAVIDRFARGDDQNFGGIFGLLWQLTEEVSLGMTYKFQPEFDYQADLIKSRPVPNTPPEFSSTGVFDIPDSIGFGVSIHPVDNATLNLDANRIYYSEITDQLLDFTSASTQEGSITQAMPDITEIHVGFEWIFANLAQPLSLRFGYWYEPYHAATNNVDDSQILEGSIFDPVLRDIFFLNQFEKNENHYAMGLGWTFGTRFQLDFAVEVADSSHNGTVSGIYRF